MAIKTIIAALALEVEGDPVAGRAMQLAEQHGARLIVVHVIEDVIAADRDLPLTANQDAILTMLEREAREQLEQLFKTAPASTEIMVETGSPHDRIDKLVRQHAADLVVIGPGRAQNIREKVFGSTVDRVVRSSSCPVLVVKARAMDPYRRIVAAVDFSALSLAAAQLAARIAPTATMDLIHAVEIPLSFEQAMMKTGTPQTEIERYRRARAQSARKQLLAALSKTEGLPEEAKIRVLQGAAGDALSRLARRGGTDLIALGTQGRNAVSRLVLGSVARKVLGAASSDVLLMPVGA